MKLPLPYILGMAGAAALALVVLPAPSHGDATSELMATTALLEDLTTQQTKLAENQAKMDEKIAAIAEEVRQARLFTARGGGHK